jgi:hypothetical protein
MRTKLPSTEQLIGFRKTADVHTSVLFLSKQHQPFAVDYVCVSQVIRHFDWFSNEKEGLYPSKSEGDLVTHGTIPPRTIHLRSNLY